MYVTVCFLLGKRVSLRTLRTHSVIDALNTNHNVIHRFLKNPVEINPKVNENDDSKKYYIHKHNKHKISEGDLAKKPLNPSETTENTEHGTYTSSRLSVT